MHRLHGVIDDFSGYINFYAHIVFADDCSQFYGGNDDDLTKIASIRFDVRGITDQNFKKTLDGTLNRWTTEKLNSGVLRYELHFKDYFPSTIE